MTDKLITFIIPSKGRATLANTLCSLYEQNCNDWNAIVIFDDVEPTITKHKNIYPIKTPHKYGEGVNSAGNVRNFGINYALSTDICGQWIGFVDDDDILNPNYIELLKNYNNSNNLIDIICFSMIIVDNNRVIPSNTYKNIKNLENDIGISFACKKEVFSYYKKKFIPNSGEDYQFLSDCYYSNLNLYISSEITYKVAPLGVAPDRRPK